MDSLFLLAVAISPPIMVVYFIKKADYHEEEPIEKLIKAFLFGILMHLHIPFARPFFVLQNYLLYSSSQWSN